MNNKSIRSRLFNFRKLRSQRRSLHGLNFDADDLVTIGGLNGSPSPNGGVVNFVGDTAIAALDSYGLEFYFSENWTVYPKQQFKRVIGSSPAKPF